MFYTTLATTASNGYCSRRLSGFGKNKEIKLLREKIWFPRTDEEVKKERKKVIGNCIACQANGPDTSPEPLQMSLLPPEPWHTVHMDFCAWSLPNWQISISCHWCLLSFPRGRYCSLHSCKRNNIKIGTNFLNSWNTINCEKRQSQIQVRSKTLANNTYLASGKLRSWKFHEAFDQSYLCSSHRREKLEKRTLYISAKLQSYSAYHNRISTIKSIIQLSHQNEASTSDIWSWSSI